MLADFRLTVSAQVKQNLICDGIPQPSRKTEIIRFIAIITAVTIPFIILQGVSRYLVTKFWWDDGIMLVAGVSSPLPPKHYRLRFNFNI